MPMAVIGALVIQALSTTVVMSGVPPTYNLLIKSLVIVAVLLLQSPAFRQQLMALIPVRS